MSYQTWRPRFSITLLTFLVLFLVARYYFFHSTFGRLNIPGGFQPKFYHHWQLHRLTLLMSSHSCVEWSPTKVEMFYAIALNSYLKWSWSTGLVVLWFYNLFIGCDGNSIWLYLLRHFTKTIQQRCHYCRRLFDHPNISQIISTARLIVHELKLETKSQKSNYCFFINH